MVAAASRGLSDSHSHTSNTRTDFDKVKAGSTYRAAICSLDPGLEALVVQVVAAREQVRDGFVFLGRLSGYLGGLVGTGPMCKRVNRQQKLGSGCGLVWGGEVAETDYTSLGHCGWILKRKKSSVGRRDSYVDGGEGTQAGPGFKYE
jgi:hypothetical protein